MRTTGTVAPPATATASPVSPRQRRRTTELGDRHASPGHLLQERNRIGHRREAGGGSQRAAAQRLADFKSVFGGDLKMLEANYLRFIEGLK